MADDFLPLKVAPSANGAAATFRHRVISAAHGPAPFTPLPDLKTSAPGSACSASDPPAATKIDIHREGDRIVRIDVHCACGRLCELHCRY